MARYDKFRGPRTRWNRRRKRPYDDEEEIMFEDLEWVVACCSETKNEG